MKTIYKIKNSTISYLSH